MSKMESDNNLANREHVEVFLPHSGEYIILILRGKMVYENASAIGKILESKLQEKCSYVVDVDALERLDSTGFGVLMTFAKKVAKQASGKSTEPAAGPGATAPVRPRSSGAAGRSTPRWNTLLPGMIR